MRCVRLAIGTVAASLLVAPLTAQAVPGASAAPAASVVRTADGTGAGADSADSADSADTARGKGGKDGGRKKRFEPRLGAIFNDPVRYGARRTIITQIVRSIQNTAKGEKIRIATWNFDDKPAKDALLAAKRRGVRVQVVVSGAVQNPHWSALKRGLNRNRDDKSFAVQCTGGCRSRVNIMHSKFYLFSRVHRARRITMIGSSNLTTPAGNRQWNDLVTMRSRKVYRYMTRTFAEYARDKSLRKPHDAETLGPYRIWLYPVGDRNPQLEQLKKVKCRGATGGTGSNGRTKIRISVAGWFDTYGEDVAQRLRHLWDRGCDIRVVTTLAGRGVNRALKARHGRGPVPQRELSFDRNFDGLPDRYLHQKSMAISGVFGGDRSASVVFTGSPNWSIRASRSEEVWLRILGRERLTRRYLQRIDRMFTSPFSSARATTRAELRRAVVAHARTKGGPTAAVTFPEWLELD